METQQIQNFICHKKIHPADKETQICKEYLWIKIQKINNTVFAPHRIGNYFNAI